MMRRTAPRNHRCFKRSRRSARAHSLDFGVRRHAQAKSGQQQRESNQQCSQNSQRPAVAASVVADDAVEIRDADMFAEPTSPCAFFIKRAAPRLCSAVDDNLRRQGNGGGRARRAVPLQEKVESRGKRKRPCVASLRRFTQGKGHAPTSQNANG